MESGWGCGGQFSTRSLSAASRGLANVKGGIASTGGVQVAGWSAARNGSSAARVRHLAAARTVLVGLSRYAGHVPVGREASIPRPINCISKAVSRLE